MSERVKRIAAALAIIKQDYTLRHITDHRSYVANAVGQLIDAGYAPAATQAQELPCGHPASLLVSSVESDYACCELCDTRSRRDDAEQRELELLMERDSLLAKIAILKGSGK
jgi:hypothetical protein